MVTSQGNSTTVVTNANLTGEVTSVGNVASLGSFTLARLNEALSDADITANQPTVLTFPATGLGSVDVPIPSWATKIDISLSDIRQSATGDMRLILGNATSFETTGYQSGCTETAADPTMTPSTDGIPCFVTPPVFSTEDLHGTWSINKSTGLLITAVGQFFNNISGGKFSQCVSSKLMTGALTRIRVYAGSGRTFTDGTVTVRYS
jgi:hypothetical protein